MFISPYLISWCSYLSVSLSEIILNDTESLTFLNELVFSIISNASRLILAVYDQKSNTYYFTSFCMAFFMALSIMRSGSRANRSEQREASRASHSFTTADYA